MTVNQLSIFLENRAGTLTKVLDLFKEAGILIIASSIAYSRPDARRDRPRSTSCTTGCPDARY